MKLIPVALALFYRKLPGKILEVWVQIRTDDGPYHGLLEFPGGGIEPGEEPLAAAIREVEEEVGINVNPTNAQFMGTYTNEFAAKKVLLYLYLFRNSEKLLEGKGQWLSINAQDLSSPYRNLIPGPNHQMIDDLYRSLYDGGHE